VAGERFVAFLFIKRSEREAERERERKRERGKLWQREMGSKVVSYNLTADSSFVKAAEYLSNS